MATGFEANPLMRATLRDYLAPVLREFGFKGSLPHFRRTVGRRVHIVTIQFSQWSGKYCVNLAVCSTKGVTGWTGKHKPANKVTAYDLSLSPAKRRLTLNKSHDEWFNFDKPGVAGRNLAMRCARRTARLIATQGERFFGAAPALSRWPPKRPKKRRS